MAQYPFGFADPRNPYPTGYQPIPSTPSVPSIGGALKPSAPDYGPFGPSMLSPDARSLMQVQQLRNPALSTTPRTPKPGAAPTLAGGDKDANGNLIASPNSQDAAAAAAAAPSGADAQAAMTAQQNQQNQTNMFGLTPEQMQQRMARADQLQQYQMGLSGMGIEADATNRFEKFGEGFRPGIGGRGKYGRINSALSGAAEGYTAGTAMRERKEMLEAIKGLRNTYANQGRAQDYAGKATAAQQGVQTSGVDMAGWNPEAEMAAQNTVTPAPERDDAAALQKLLDDEERRKFEETMLQPNQSAGGGLFGMA